MANILAKFFGNYSKRELKRIQPLCDEVLALVPESTGRYLKDNWPLKPQRSGAQHPFL